MIALFPAREVFIALGPLEIRWYGFFYVVAFWLALWLLPRLQKWRGLMLTKDAWLVALAALAAGVVAGGRLGYALFYEPEYFLQRPVEIFALWQGGMASHGGFIGVAVAVVIAARYLNVDLLKLSDVIVVPVALGLMLGRLGNWINDELYVSQFAHLAAIAKNLLIAGACYYWLKRGNKIGAGSVTALFLILYGLLRWLMEYWREQPWPLVWGLTRGQLLTLPILAMGVLLLVWRSERKKYNV